MISFAKDAFDENLIEKLKTKLRTLYMEEGELMYQEMTLEQVPIYAQILNFLTPVYPHSTKIKNHFHQVLRRIFSSKKAAKALSFEDLIVILEALPPVDS